MQQKIQILGNALQDRYCRLLLLTGVSDAKQSFIAECQKSFSCAEVHVSKELSVILMDCPVKQRPGRISEYMSGFLSDNTPVLLSEIEILFDRNLRNDPVSLLKSAARNRILLVDWPGKFDFSSKQLSYATSSSSEFYETIIDNDILCFDVSGESSIDSER